MFKRFRSASAGVVATGATGAKALGDVLSRSFAGSLPGVSRNSSTAMPSAAPADASAAIAKLQHALKREPDDSATLTRALTDAGQQLRPLAQHVEDRVANELIGRLGRCDNPSADEVIAVVLGARPESAVPGAIRRLVGATQSAERAERLLRILVAVGTANRPASLAILEALRSEHVLTRAFRQIQEGFPALPEFCREQLLDIALERVRNARLNAGQEGERSWQLVKVLFELHAAIPDRLHAVLHAEAKEFLVALRGADERTTWRAANALHHVISQQRVTPSKELAEQIESNRTGFLGSRVDRV